MNLFCILAYWGEPNKVGGRCSPCECNSNIDPYDWNACDQQTGRCVNCLNNTAGPMCERCRDWFYGDAIRAKNCAAMLMFSMWIFTMRSNVRTMSMQTWCHRRDM